jgi:hypothetical protein
MKKIKKQLLWLIAISVTIPLNTNGKRLKTEDELRSLTKEVFEEFRVPVRTLNIELGRVIFSENLPTHTANGSPDIVINLGEIAAYTADKNKNFKKLFVQFVIAHEIGHKLQQQHYQKEVIDQTKGEGAIFLECNADILAGFLMTDVINTVEVPALIRANPSFDFTRFTNENTDEMLNVYRNVFTMNQSNTFINTHPSHIQRLMAIKDGIMMGICTLISFTDAAQSRIPKKEIELIVERYNNIAKAINFDNPQNKNPFIWAQDEAIQITHENNELARNLVRYRTKVQRIHANQRYFNYSFSIYNNNPVKIRFAGRVYTAIHSRSNEDAADIIKKIPWDSESFDRTIEAGQSIEISGQLKYAFDDDYTADLIMPGDPESLYFVFDAANPGIDISQKVSSDDNFKAWTSRSLINIDDHIKKILNKSSNFYPYTKGIAISRENDEQEIFKGIRYIEPTFKAGMEPGQRFFYVGKHKLIYEFNACELKNPNEVREHFYEINQKIQSSYRGIYKALPIENDNGELSQAYVDNNSRKIMIVSFRKNYSSEDFCVEVEVGGSDGH